MLLPVLIVLVTAVAVGAVVLVGVVALCRIAGRADQALESEMRAKRRVSWRVAQLRAGHGMRRRRR